MNNYVVISGNLFKNNLAIYEGGCMEIIDINFDLNISNNIYFDNNAKFEGAAIKVQNFLYS